MELLLKQLEELFNQQNNHYTDDDGWVYFKDNELYNEVVGLCCELLIANNGRCNWDNIIYLRNNGYSVFAGDKDSFGWLIGCIRKNDDPLRRTICYG